MNSRIRSAGCAAIFAWAFAGMVAHDASGAPQVIARAASTDQTKLQYVAPGARGNIRLTLEREGADLVLRDDNQTVASAPMAAVSAVEIGSPDFVDTSLTIDYGSGSIAVPIDYHPGALGPDTDNVLALRGSNVTNEVYTMTGPHSGTIELDGVPIRFVNLTPINDTAAVTTYTFNDFGGTTLNVVDGPIVGGFQTTQINGSGFETTNIANKTNVVINGQLPSTTYTVNNPTPATGMTRMLIVGLGGGNTFNITPSATVPIIVQGSPISLFFTAPTDTMTINGAGVTNLLLASVSNIFGVAGRYTFSNRTNVDFQNMAAVSPTGPAAGCQLAPAPALGTSLLLALGVMIAGLAIGRLARGGRGSDSMSI